VNGSPAPLLRVDNLHRSYGGVSAVAGASFDVARGSMTALIGPNGAGKTTAFDLISGFLRPHAGAILYRDTSIGGFSPERIAGLGLVRTFQLTRIFSVMTVLENMLVASQENRGERLSQVFLRPLRAKRGDDAARTRALAILARYGLGDMANEFGGGLSGGQRKLLELARVLMAEPTLVLLDEPFAGVNPTLKRELLVHIEEMRAGGITVLFIEHDMEVVMQAAEHVIVMANGSVVAAGTPEQVRRDPRVLDAYLGTHAT
jgi:ABC-type branched-subunit amino acid transport system ATPase component